MKETKTCRLLKLLEPAQTRELAKTLPPGKAAKLLAALLDFHPNFDSKWLTRKRIARKVFPEKEVGEQRWRNLLSELNQAIERFIVQQMLFGRPDVFETLLSLAFSKMSSPEIFQEQAERTFKALDESKTRDRFFLLQKMLLHRALHFHPTTDRWNQDPAQLDDFDAALDAFYWLEKRQIQAERLNRAHIFSEKKAPAAPQNLAPAVGLFEKTVQLREGGDLTLFREIRAGLEDPENRLSVEDARALLTHLLNFAVGRVNAGQQDFNPELFQLYRFGLTSGHLRSGGFLMESAFINYAQIGAALGEFEEVESFLTKNKPNLPPENRENIHALMFGNLHFQKALRLKMEERRPELEIVLDCLGKVEGIRGERMLQIQVKILDLKTWFELSLLPGFKIENLVSKIHAFEVWLPEAGLSGEKTLAYREFARFVRLLNSERNAAAKKNRKPNRENLLQKLAAIDQINNRQWIREKVEGFRV